MLAEFCIVYGYHLGGKATVDVVRDHHLRLHRDNPKDVVVPVVCGYEPCIPGTIDVRSVLSWGVDPFEKPGDQKHQDQTLWAHNDLLLWRYLRHPAAVRAKRYVYFDWDVYSHGMSVREFYVTVEGADVVAIEAPTPATKPGWVWWWEWPKRLPPELCVGMLPFCGAMFSRRAAWALANADPEDVAPNFQVAQNELRVGVMARRLGYEIKELGSRATMLHTYGGPCRLRDVPGIYHPVPYIPRF